MTEERQPAGQFAPGSSGNALGRPARVMELRAQVGDRIRPIIEKLVAQALEGDTRAAKLLIERLYPALRLVSPPVHLSLAGSAGLTDQARSVLAAIAAGEVAPDVGASIITAIGALGQLRSLDELEARLRKLEKIDVNDLV